jgi:rhodanese-related sulfurtransferase
MMSTPVIKISRQEIQAKLQGKEKVAIAEALPQKYYDQAHLPGAVNLPHDQVDQLAPRLFPDKSQEIIVYCANTPCQNSAIAAHRLAALGYTQVREYVEGKQDWVEAGLPTEAAVPQAVNA